MLILLEANYPIPLIKALQAAMLAYPKETVRVVKDGPSVEEDLDGRTIVFMMNRDKKRIAPAVRQRCEQGYHVFALRRLNDESFDPFQLTIQVLSLLPKIIDVIESDKDPFVYLLQLRTRQINKIILSPMRQITLPQVKVKTKGRRTKKTRLKIDNELTLFPSS